MLHQAHRTPQCRARNTNRNRRGRVPSYARCYTSQIATPTQGDRATLKRAARSLRLSRRSHNAALPPTTTQHFPLTHECPNRDAQSRSARHHDLDFCPTQSWVGRRLFRQCLKDTGRVFCWHPETPGRGAGELRGLCPFCPARCNGTPPVLAFAALCRSRRSS